MTRTVIHFEWDLGEKPRILGVSPLPNDKKPDKDELVCKIGYNMYCGYFHVDDIDDAFKDGDVDREKLSKIAMDVVDKSVGVL